MDGDSNIAAIGSLLANPGRCRILFALADGRALPASRLAIEAEQRPHLSGALGATLLERLFEHGWLRHSPSSRATHPTEEGRAGLKSRFGLKRDESDGAVVTFEQRRWSPVKGEQATGGFD